MREKLQVFVTAGPGNTKVISINNDTNILDDSLLGE